MPTVKNIQPNVSYIYYIFEPCCGGSPINFQPAVTLLPFTLPHQLVYDAAGVYGDQFGLESGFCYTVSEGVTSDIVFYTGLTTLVNAWMSYTDIGFDDCSPLYVECAPCPNCYLLISCDGSVPSFTTTFNLSAYVGTSVILSSSDFPATCFQVLLNPGTAPCGPSTPPLLYVGVCTCECDCYSVSAFAKNCYYIDCDGNLAWTGALVSTAEVKFCSQTYPVIQGIVPNTFWNITNSGPCIYSVALNELVCDLECYKLEDCDNILPDIYTTKTSLGIYAIVGAVVIIDGYPDTCWEVTDTASCDCAIDVTVFQYFLDCPTCKGTPKYKLTKCDDPATIVYTSTNLSAYVNQVIIRLDCPGCWIVEEVDLIPSDVIITVDTSYIDCIECARTYYLLEDCSGLLPDVITYTDLSAYVGSVIKLEYCPETCWEVSITLNPTNAGIVVFTDIEYIDCDECLDTLPCICTTVRNDDTTVVSNDYRYLDCDHNVQNFTLQFGETSPKFCMIAWQYNHPTTDYVETFGNCSEVTGLPWVCPAPIYPRRDVRPGYKSPSCTPERYEKISCKSAEGYYKQVLYLRYGITDCCPDDTNKWFIKKELIDMDAMRDPDYVCTVVNPCCPSSPSCNCSTSTTTCNSQ